MPNAKCAVHARRRESGLCYCVQPHPHQIYIINHHSGRVPHPWLARVTRSDFFLRLRPLERENQALLSALTIKFHNISTTGAIRVHRSIYTIIGINAERILDSRNQVVRWMNILHDNPSPRASEVSTPSHSKCVQVREMARFAYLAP